MDLCQNKLCICYKCVNRGYSCCHSKCYPLAEEIGVLTPGSISTSITEKCLGKCKDFKEVPSWEEIEKMWDAIQCIITSPNTYSKKPIDYVFDEDKSVKWNREQVVSYNKDLDRIARELNDQLEVLQTKYKKKLDQRIHWEIPQISLNKAHFLYGYYGEVAPVEQVEKEVDKLKLLLKKED